MMKLGSRPPRGAAIVLSILCTVLALACETEPGGAATPAPPGSGAGHGTPGAAPPGNGMGAGPVTAAPPAAASTGGAPVAPALSGDAGANQPPVGATGLPAEVCKVLQDNACITCHQTPLAAGAPMPLQSRSDFAGNAKDGSPMGAKVLARAEDARAPMPPATTMRPLMPAADLAVLRTWIEAGMPAAATAHCAEAAAPPVPKGVEWAYQPWPEGECEYVLSVGAHGASGTPRAMDASPFTPPAQETGYHCFYEKVPWGDKKVQALATRVRLEGPDDGAIVHHMVLSALAPGSGMSALGGATPTRGGQHHQCDNPSGATVGVWAPGPNAMVTFPEDVGVLMPSGSEAYIELQVHYNNTKAGQQSRVAFDICATTKLRPQEAAVHWLGYDNALLAIPLAPFGPDLQPHLDNNGDGTATGTCRAKERTRVLWFAPHMHELGRHAKIEVLRKSGAVETVHDSVFDFQEQTAYFQPALWLEQGESIRTTCSWSKTRPIVFGFASDEEMCFVYTLSYPVGALAGQGAELGVVGGDLNCAGSP